MASFVAIYQTSVFTIYCSEIANDQQYFKYIRNCVLYTIPSYNKDGQVNFTCFVKFESYAKFLYLNIIYDKLVLTNVIIFCTTYFFY